MTVVQLAPVIGAVVALLSMVVAAIWWVGKKTVETKIAALEADAAQKIGKAECQATAAEAETAKLKADLSKQIYEARLRAAKVELQLVHAEAVRLKVDLCDRNHEARPRPVEPEFIGAVAEVSAAKKQVYREVLEDLRSKISSEASTLTDGLLLRYEIESELRYAMQDLGVTESSVVVKDPDPGSDEFVFLAVHGAAAGVLTKMKVQLRSTAGFVFTGGRPVIGFPDEDPESLLAVSQKGKRGRRDMLTVPLYRGDDVVGVAQFLRKRDGLEFSGEDERLATAAVVRVAVKVGDFVSDVDHFSQVGLYSPPQRYSAAIVFCDIGHSSSLFDVLGESQAVACVNEYLTRVTEIVLDAGGAVDGYLGDGAMFRFVDDLPAAGGNATVLKAVNAALRVVDDFGRIKEAWLRHDRRVEPVHSRVSVSYGPYREVRMGPMRHRENLVVGASVHRAAQMCQLASRERTLVVVDAAVAALVGDEWRLEATATDGLGKTFYEVRATP